MQVLWYSSAVKQLYLRTLEGFVYIDTSSFFLTPGVYTVVADLKYFLGLRNIYGLYMQKSYNATILLYHLVFLAKYRKVRVECGAQTRVPGGNKKHEVKFLAAISTDILSETTSTNDPKYKTAKHIFDKCPKVKQKLWCGKFCTDRYFASAVDKNNSEDMIGKYVTNQRC